MRESRYINIFLNGRERDKKIKNQIKDLPLGIFLFAFLGLANNLADALPTGDNDDLSISRSWKEKSRERREKKEEKSSP